MTHEDGRIVHEDTKGRHVCWQLARSTSTIYNRALAMASHIVGANRHEELSLQSSARATNENERRAIVARALFRSPNPSALY